MRTLFFALALSLILIFPGSALGDSIDYQGAGSLSQGTAAQFGSIRPGHVWEVVTQLIEIDNLTTGMIEHGILGTIDITSGTLFNCAHGLCFHGGSIDIDAVNNSSIFDSPFSGGTISVVNGISTLTAHFGGRVAAAVIRNNHDEFSSQALTRSSAPVPEAGTFLLLGTGLLALAGVWRKRLA